MDTPSLVHNELDVLAELVPLQDGPNIIELGCGNARMATELLRRFDGSRITGLEVDTRQHAKNLANRPAELTDRLHFLQESATAIPFADGSFDGAMMLKSLHHIPLDAMQTALAETWRVLGSNGWLYVSEPVYAGPLNEIVRLYNDEGPVRAAAQAALDTALHTGRWTQVEERRLSPLDGGDGFYLAVLRRG